MNRPSNTILSKTPTSFIYTIMNTLQPSWRAMAAIACLTAEGDMLRLPTAIADGLDHGLTIAEIKEALSQLYAYVGFPRSLNALAALQKVVEERKAQGIADAEGIDAGPMPRDFDALQEGTRVQTRLNGGQPFDYHFAPATDHYLKAHLFGDIFARNNLTFAQREWITLGALCGLSGVENQRKAHIAGARNMGVADEVILALPGVLQQLVGEQEAYRAGKSVAEFFGLPFNSPRPVRPLAFPVGEPNTAFARYFTGNSHLASLLDNGRLDHSQRHIRAGLPQQLAYPPSYRANSDLCCRQRMVSGMAKAASSPSGGRRGKYSARGETLAWSDTKQPFSASCHRFDRRTGKQRMA